MTPHQAYKELLNTIGEEFGIFKIAEITEKRMNHMKFKILLRVLKHHIKEPLITTLIISITMVLMWLFMFTMGNSVIARWVFGVSMLTLIVCGFGLMVFDFIKGIIEDYKLQSRIEGEEQCSTTENTPTTH